ncbi:hypothetical protein EV691_11520 [Azotobacter chroococcum]|uniref:Uncharacterized protein n=1 Tax=Azotobacter chroococcum TaxID=353 RepID=A0A4V2Q7B4_9GAMM|nr:hypothetical protein EV691_11520 [Azotobacter chroococcum]
MISDLRKNPDRHRDAGPAGEPPCILRHGLEGTAMASRRIVPAVITSRPRLPALSSLPDRRPVWIGDGSRPWSSDEQTQSTSPKVECLWPQKTLGNGAIGTMPAQAWYGLQPCDHRSSERLQSNTFQTFFHGTFTSLGALWSQLKDQLHRVTEPIVVLVGFFLPPLFPLFPHHHPGQRRPPLLPPFFRRSSDSLIHGFRALSRHGGIRLSRIFPIYG